MFERLRPGKGTTILWVRKGYADSLLEAGICRPGRLLDDHPIRLPGRGPVAILPLPGRKGEEAILKRYRRGGLAGKILPHLFLGTARFRREISTAETAIRKGIPVPFPLALVRKGRWGLYRVFGVTRRIPHTRNVQEIVDASLSPTRPKDFIDSIARTIHGMHERGMTHADLNLGNLLVSTAGKGPPVYIVDLVGARLGSALTAVQQLKGLRRLRRSWEKSCFFREVLPGSEIGRFLSIYCGSDRELLAVLRGTGAMDRILARTRRLGWWLARLRR